MLQSIRDHSQGWLAWAIILIISATFALWGIHNYVGSSSDAGVAATVNGDTISKNQVDASYERLRRQQQLQLGADFTINQSIEAQLKKQALNEIILSHVLAKAAASEGYRVTMEQVDNALARMPVFQVDGQFSKQRFEEVMRSLLYSDAAFLSDLRTTMVINQVQSGIVDSAFTLPNDIQNVIKLIDQKRDLAYLIIPIDYFQNGIHVDEVQIQAYYKDHPTQFATPERVSVEYIELSLPDITDKLHFDDAKLQQYYKANVDNFTKPARWKLARILIKLPENASKQEETQAQTKVDNITQHLQKGESFAALAQQFSEDAQSAKQGGQINWLAENEIDPSLSKILNKASQVGAVPGPIRTKEGINILNIVAIEKPQVQPYAKVRAEVEKALARQQAGQMFAEQSDKLANITYVHPNSLAEASKTLGLPIKNTEAFTQLGGKTGIIANPKLVAAAFNPEVLSRGNNSDVVELSSDSLIVLRIKQHEPASIKPLSEVENTIRDKLKMQLAQDKAKALGEQILMRMNEGISGKDLAKQYHLNWQYKPDAGRYDTSLDTAILAKAFRMPHPDRPNSFTSTGMALPNGGYAVIAVTGVHDGNYTSVPESKRRIFQEQIEKSLGQMDYELYIRGLMNKAKVVVKDQISSS